MTILENVTSIRDQSGNQLDDAYIIMLETAKATIQKSLTIDKFMAATISAMLSTMSVTLRTLNRHDEGDKLHILATRVHKDFRLIEISIDDAISLLSATASCK
ncbi:hypothetical protein AB4254_11870 [Vibrio breoganii]